MARKKNDIFQSKVQDTFPLVCSRCEEKTTHRVTYTNGDVHHLRCLSCRRVTIYFLQSQGLDEAPKATEVGYQEVIEKRSSKDSQSYSTKDAFADGQIIKHPTFGEGYVLDVQQPPVKMSVLFADNTRVLVCGVGSNSESEITDGQIKNTTSDTRSSPGEIRPATPTVSPPPGNEAMGDSDSELAVCPKCGKTVHPFNLYRSADGKTTIGCSFCN